MRRNVLAGKNQKKFCGPFEIVEIIDKNRIKIREDYKEVIFTRLL